ncbi:MAG: hypothetical protein V4608_05410 [Bacteroidota bacterium]
MEALILSSCIVAVASLIVRKQAGTMKKTTNRPIKVESADNSQHFQQKSSAEPPYYEKYISTNKKTNDFLDFSGGLLGI